MIARPGGLLLLALACGAALTAARAEEVASWPLLQLRLSGDGKISRLRVDRRVQVELGLTPGVERVGARIARIDSLEGALWLEVEPEQPFAPSDAGHIQGLLLRDDHARGGGSIGWAIGSVLGLWAADRAMGEGAAVLPRRLTEIGAGIAGGFLGRTGGRWLGRAWSTTRGYPVLSARAVE